MKKLALLQLLLLPVAGLLNDVPNLAAQDTKPSAACNPWSANYWGDARITSQAEADEYACFRRIVGSVTLIQSSEKLIVLPKLHGVAGDLRIVFSAVTRERELREPRRALAQMMPLLEDVTGNVDLEYARGESALRSVLVPHSLGTVAVRGKIRVAFRRVEVETASTERTPTSADIRGSADR
jgi:hypothetical protein